MVASRRVLATVMFTDMVGYSALAQRDEDLAIVLLNEHRVQLRSIFDRCGGREIDAVGDAFLVAFSSAMEAARCAVDIQESLSARNAGAHPDRRIEVRIGLHVGDFVEEGAALLGDGVNVAARIQQIAAPGQILVSEELARLIRNKPDFQLRDLGGRRLKNLQQRVRVFELHKGGTAHRDPFRRREALNGTRADWRVGGVIALLFGVLMLLPAVVSLLQEGIHRQGGSRIAVLPFNRLSAAPEDEYFADGLTEEVISRLSRVEGLEVIARTSSMTYKGARKKISDIGRELRVGVVLEGSIRKHGSVLRITAQLISVDNESPIWSTTYDDDSKDAFGVQQRLSERVAQALADMAGGTMPAVSRVSHPPESSETYLSYLKGRYFLAKSTEGDALTAIRHFKDAVRRDPSFALAHLALAEAHLQLPTLDDVHAKTSFPAARGHAVQALALDPTLAEAHAALGIVTAFNDYDWPGAQAHFDTALRLNPNASNTYWWQAWYRLFQRQYDTGIEAMRKAVSLDPVSISKSTDLGWAYQFAGKWDLAIEHLRSTTALDPDNAVPWAALGWAYLGKGRYVEADAAFDKELKVLGPQPWVLIDIIASRALRGDMTAARQTLRTLESASRDQNVSAWAWVIVYFSFATQDASYREQMFDWLDKARQERSFWIGHTSNGWWRRFHGDARWISFRAGLGLPP